MSLTSKRRMERMFDSLDLGYLGVGGRSALLTDRQGRSGKGQMSPLQHAGATARR